MPSLGNAVFTSPRSVYSTVWTMERRDFSLAKVVAALGGGSGFNSYGNKKIF